MKHTTTKPIFTIKSKKLLFCLLLAILFFKGYSQNPNLVNLSPGGVLEIVFDQYGKQYNLSDLMIDTQNSSSVSKTALLTCSSTSYFNLYFEDGSGMETVADPTQNGINSARRAVVCKVFEDISNFINSPLSNPGNTTKVNIWVRNINNVLTNPNGVLGLATSFYNLPYNTTKGGIADGEIWKTIHLGKDSYTNVTTPLVMTSNTTILPGAFYHGMMAVNFNTNNTTPINWCTTLATPALNGQVDLYSTVLHEVCHALGFVSLIDQNGKSKLGVNYKYYSRYDTFLKNNAATLPIIKTSSTLSGLYDNAFNTALSTTILRPTCTLTNFENTSTSIDNTICNNALKYVGSTTASVYTPICYEAGSSFSHFEDQLYPTCASPYGNNNYFVMSNAQSANAPYNTKRYLKPEEKAVLCDIGYSVKSSFGSSSVALTATTLGPYNYSSGSCGGIIVAGINDGLNLTTSSYTYTGNAGSTIPISGILANDINANGFQGLQDLTATTTLVTTGTATTTINFSSTVTGLHLLRYVPTYTDTAGTQKGNITYIYVYVKELPATTTANTCVPTATICNLVSNGDFEQKSSLPTNYSTANDKQIRKVCGWNDATIGGTADYFNSGATATSTMQIPCNLIGTQTSNSGGNGYIGLYFSSPNTGNESESVYTKLSSPLVANNTYQLSFDISLAEGSSSFGYGMQAYLSPTLLTVPISGNAVPTGVTIMKENPTVFHSNYSTWDTVTFTYTATGGEQYLYLGGLQDVVATSLTAAPNTTNCQYSNYNGFSPTSKLAYYYFDNVTLIPTNGAVFNLSDSICSTATIPNLADYLSAVVTTGVFSGPGVTYNPTTGIYSFNASTAGTGPKTITYTFTNNINCSIKLYDTITVLTQPVTPTFSFTTTVCKMGAITLPLTSDNGIAGTWSPNTVNTTVAGTFSYIFTPSGTQCAVPVTIPIIVKNPVTPTFIDLAETTALCEGVDPPLLPTVSSNNITGTWNPATVSNTATGNYLFTPTLGQCANSKNYSLFVLLNSAFVANNDTFTVFSGTTAVTTTAVSYNDTYTGGPLPNNAGLLGADTFLAWSILPYVTAAPPASGSITFDAATGIFTIAPNTTPGTYVYTYTISTSCYETAPATVTVIVNPAVSSPLRLGFNFCYKNNGTTASSSSTSGNTSLYDGVTFNGQPITSSSNAVINILNGQSLPITINSSDGSFTFAGGTLPQNVLFYYTVTVGGVTSGTIACLLQIRFTLQANSDGVTFNSNGSGTYNVLSNDIYYGDCSSSGAVPASSSNVTVTQLAPFNSYYSIGASGNINLNLLGNFPPPGTYALSYQICDKIYPLICQTANVFINVPAPFAPTTNPITSKKTNHFTNEDIVINPNPSNGIFEIYFNDTIEQGDIEIYTVVGQKIYSETISNSNQSIIKLNESANGTYIVKINIDGQLINKRIIVK